MNAVVAKNLHSPSHARGRKDTQLVRIVDHHSIISTNSQSAHGFSEVGRGWEHMWVGRVSVNDLIYIEEAGIGNSLLAEGLEAIERRGREEPRRTDGDGPWGSRDLRGRKVL